VVFKWTVTLNQLKGLQALQFRFAAAAAVKITLSKPKQELTQSLFDFCYFCYILVCQSCYSNMVRMLIVTISERCKVTIHFKVGERKDVHAHTTGHSQRGLQI